MIAKTVSTPAPTQGGLSLQGVSIRRGSKWVVSDVSMQANPGEILAIMGPNGAGKSSLLRAIAGLLPAHGEIRFAGRDLSSDRARDRAKSIAYVPQRSHLEAALTVREVVAQGRLSFGSFWSGQTPDDNLAIAEALGSCDLEAYGDRLFTQLSYGEQRRCIVARALASRAPCIVLDEPSSALDVSHVLTLFATLRTLATSGRCVVVVLHDLNEARQVADKVLLLNHGRSQGAGSVEDVLCASKLAQVYGVARDRSKPMGCRLLD